MALKPDSPEQSHSERDEYFISMTDMMGGLIFLVIIMLMFFALKFETATSKTEALVKSFESSEEVRDAILTKIKQDMASRGYVVLVNPIRGALSLPENLLFERGRSELAPQGVAAIGELGQVLYTDLLCYTGTGINQSEQPCTLNSQAIEAVLIEGHTDSDGDFNANWDLSVKRSFATYRSLIAASPQLDHLVNKEGQPIFSIAGFGRQRPIAPNDSIENKARNRRVDIRLIMLPPKSSELGAHP